MNASIKPADDSLQSKGLTPGPSSGLSAPALRMVDSEPQTLYANGDLLSLLDDAPVGIHWVDANGIITWANRTELTMLGYARQDYVGHHITEFHVDKHVIADILCSLSSGQTLESKVARLRHRDGSVRVGSINSNVLWENGQFIHTRCFTRDVTDSIAIEAERSRTQERLAENVRIKDSLYQLTDQLQRADSLQDIYSAALLAIQDALRCDRAAILLFDEAGEMRFVGWRGLSDAYRRAVEGHSPWQPNDDNAQPICIDNIETSDLTDSLKATVKSEGIGALAFIPLFADDKLIGKFMAYFNTAHEFGPEDLNLCISIARQLAFGIEHHRAEDSLRESERRFRSMFDALPAAIYTTDADGRVTYFNPAAKEISGHDPAIGSDLWCVDWKLYQPDGTLLPHDQCHMAVALRERRSVRGAEAIIERPDGTRRWVTPYPTPIFDAKGRMVAGINMVVDITDRKLAEQAIENQARQLALITDTAPVYIAYCDIHSRYKFVNAPYAARFGLQPTEVAGKHLSEILGHETFAEITPHVAAVLSGKRVEFDTVVSHNAHEHRMMHCSYAPEYGSDGQVIGFVAAIADITERKRVEDALRTSEEKLKETDRRKDEFLAMLSHELRNPLAPIANAVHLLRNEPTQSPVFQQARAIIERQTARLARLVDDLLEVSRITTGRIQLQMERIAIGGIIERAVETVRPLIEQHRHHLTVSLPSQTLWLNADGARIEQVFINLLTNAAKYTDDGGSIELTAEFENHELVVRIKDTGIGISAELLPHVFELFMQSERALDRSQGGLGIGLALVQRLVSMHGGTVSADSHLGRGSEFTVRLPAAAAPEIPVTLGASQSNQAPETSLRVLIVDDNVDAATSLGMLVQLSGHTVWLVHDGEAALETAASCRPHIVFLDIGLPKLDGYSVASRLRTSTDPTITLVAITGYGQLSDRQRAHEAGFHHHLVKPVVFSMMETILGDVSAQLRSS